MKTIVKSLLLVAGMGVAFTSCKKDRDTDITSAEDNSLAENTYDDVNDIADQAAKGSQSFKVEDGSGILSNCAIVTFDTNTAIKDFTIDFGTGCLCSDGKTRSGKILVSRTGHYRDSGTVITITFDNFFVNNNQVEGSRVVTNNGTNAAGNISFSVEVNGTVTKADGTVITWTSSRTREWIDGYETIGIHSDDVYRVSGTASGSRVNGSTSTTFSAMTVTPLVRKVACHQFVSGTAKVTPSGKPERTIDFGSGECDNEAVVTVNGNTRTITLH